MKHTLIKICECVCEPCRRRTSVTNSFLSFFLCLDAVIHIPVCCELSLLGRAPETNLLCSSFPSSQMSSKRSSSFRRAIANGRRTLQREILLDETGLGLYKRFVRYVAYEILPCETDRRWYFHQNRLCPPPVFIAIVTIVQVSIGWFKFVRNPRSTFAFVF